MKKRIFIVLIFFWTIPSGFAQLKSYTFEEAVQLTKENPKPIVVFIHTNWCKYCKMMENSTFKNPEIISILNDNFYFVPLDAETKTDISYENHTFKYLPNGQNTGIHELATALATLNNEVSYPTITILDKKNSILLQKQSYLKTKELISILKKTLELAIFEKKSFPNP
ncbi:thioredoxin family protein [Flavobacterium flavipallidum]|uniref:Thioredoxin family protein n=1 Tax=Flavobacterium flavipallidum TaxID=3139140 RepID=A0ABU9HR07_9FLAO